MPEPPTVHLRTLDRGVFCEHFVTVVAPLEVLAATAAEGAFAALAGTVADRGISPIQEVAYGPSQQRQALLDSRRAAFERASLDPALPCSMVDGRPGEHRGPVAVQLWGITSTDGGAAVRTVELPAGRRGRLLETPGMRALWVGAIAGQTADGTLTYGPSDQAAQMFANAQTALQSQGFDYADVRRTWIRLRRILSWYDEFNQVRTAFHRQRGITGAPGGLPLPASTGIQGCSASEECVMDLLAIQTSGAAWRTEPLERSSQQLEPMAYGSGFSRGMALRHSSADTLLISGTASISADGATVHVGDPRAQAEHTLQAISALLEPEGAQLEDIAAGVLYFKDEPTRQAVVGMLRQARWPELPLVPVLADVCRPELLVEIEALALASKGANTPNELDERSRR